MKELPTGLQEFEHIRTSGALYVDKTDMIHNIVSGARKHFFIARPRRFGKTLLCRTLDALFSGKRELFEGLVISKTGWAWESWPVIHLDMSKVETAYGIDGVKETLIRQIKNIAAEFEIDFCGLTVPGAMLTELIVGVSKRYGKPAVVIVDEYDKPFLDFYNKPPMAQEVRDIMRGCYSQFKANEPHMRFLFMTGISKFAKSGVFSTLNNLNDLSLDENFGTMLGYTEKELTEYFSEHIELTAAKLQITVDGLVEKIRLYYNGFCFDGVNKVYCPFSVLNFFQTGKFDNFWMESASPRIIADYMKGRNLTVEQFRGIVVSRNFVRDPGEIETSPPEGFLYQAGYLTLREEIDSDYSLDYPNAEVLNSMSELVAQNIVQDGGGNFLDFRTSLMEALANGDSELLIETVNRLLASIPYDDYINAAKQGRRISREKLTAQEWLYRSTILAFFRGCGVLAFGEMHGCQGRSDLLLIHRNMPWIIEIKVADNDDCAEKAQEAMTQINDRQYAAPYKNGKKIAITINGKTRQIGEWIAS
jgi:hypothetical protein